MIGLGEAWKWIQTGFCVAIGFALWGLLLGLVGMLRTASAKKPSS